MTTIEGAPVPGLFLPDTALPCRVFPAVNVEQRKGMVRPSLLILHYTGMSSAEKAVRWLACGESRVSCHYVVDEAGAIVQLVPEGLRAWHAGVSSWRGEVDINSASIGIEIQNPGHEDGYPDFPSGQMATICALAREIMGRHGLRPQDVLAHSDVAPARKIDPGEKFDWRLLHANGVGHWVEPVPVDAEDGGFELGYFGSAVREAQAALNEYGYGIEITGTLDEATRFVLRAFQLHFRPERCDGRLDRSTMATLRRLIEAMPSGPLRAV